MPSSASNPDAARRPAPDVAAAFTDVSVAFEGVAILDDVTASVINTNFAGEAGLVPARDALVMEGSESPYANIVVVRNEDKDSPKAKALMKAVQSPEVKAYIQKNLVERGIVPVF